MAGGGLASRSCISLKSLGLSFLDLSLGLSCAIFSCSLSWSFALWAWACSYRRSWVSAEENVWGCAMLNGSHRVLQIWHQSLYSAARMHRFAHGRELCSAEILQAVKPASQNTGTRRFNNRPEIHVDLLNSFHSVNEVGFDPFVRLRLQNLPSSFTDHWIPPQHKIFPAEFSLPQPHRTHHNLFLASSNTSLTNPIGPTNPDAVCGGAGPAYQLSSQ